MKYGTYLEIGINHVNDKDKDNIRISGTLYIGERRHVSINFFISRDEKQGWKIESYHQVRRTWTASVLFPNDFPEDAWEKGYVMNWITHNIESILYISGNDRNLLRRKRETV